MLTWFSIKITNGGVWGNNKSFLWNNVRLVLIRGSFSSRTNKSFTRWDIGNTLVLSRFSHSAMIYPHILCNSLSLSTLTMSYIVPQLLTSYVIVVSWTKWLSQNPQKMVVVSGSGLLLFSAWFSHFVIWWGIGSTEDRNIQIPVHFFLWVSVEFSLGLDLKWATEIYAAKNPHGCVGCKNDVGNYCSIV